MGLTAGERVGERHRPIRARSAPGQVAGAATESTARSPSSKTACPTAFSTTRITLCPVPATTRSDRRFLPERFSCPEREQPRRRPAAAGARHRFRPDQQRRRAPPAWLLTQAERKPPSAGHAVGRRLLDCTNSDHVDGSRGVTALGRQQQRTFGRAVDNRCGVRSEIGSGR